MLDFSRAGVAVVRINRPERRNAFDELTVQALAEAFETLKGADHVRVVFVRGVGDIFCAGADVDWMRHQGERPPEDNESDALDAARMFKALHELPQLTVALVQGGAYGGGAGLVAACDVAVAVKSAGFRFSEVRLGIIPATISPFVIEAIGARWARALFASGESFDGAFAEKIGLVQYSVDDVAGLDVMAEHLGKLAFAAAPGAVSHAKKLVRDVAGQPIDDHLLKDVAKRLAARRASEEGREGLAAFLQKRKPEWDQ
jgi:methylglutaconyl-CoA hydratase